MLTRVLVAKGERMVNTRRLGSAQIYFCSPKGFLRKVQMSIDCTQEPSADSVTSIKNGTTE